MSSFVAVGNTSKIPLTSVLLRSRDKSEGNTSNPEKIKPNYLYGDTPHEVK